MQGAQYGEGRLVVQNHMDQAGLGEDGPAREDRYAGELGSEQPVSALFITERVNFFLTSRFCVWYKIYLFFTGLFSREF